MRRQWHRFGAATAIALVVDQTSKMWARKALWPGESVAVVEGFFDWHLSYNQGAAFSLLDDLGGARLLLSLVALIALSAIGWMVATGADRWMRLAALGLIAGGALGNLIDRLLFGQVTDFVLWHVRDLHWPVFNLADAFLLIGVPLLLIDEVRAERAAVADPPS